jgi:phage shock protein C
MIAHATTAQGRFTRNADRAILGGVCAGVADYFGFNLRVTRLLVIIAFFVAMPVTILTYVAIVLLVPAESTRYAHTGEKEYRRKRRRMSRRERKEAAEDARREAQDALDERARSLDERLARVEKYVTSSRYDLDREFRNLRD